MNDEIDKIEYGKLLKQMEHLSAQVDSLAKEVATLKSSMNKGWGVIVGMAMVIGLFLNDIVEGIRGWIH